MSIIKLFFFIAGFAGTLQIAQGGQDVLGLHISSALFLVLIVVLSLCTRKGHENNVYFLQLIPSFLTPPPPELASYSSFS